MRQIRLLIPVVAIFLVGCASAPTAKSTADHPKEKEQIGRVLNEVIEAAEKKDFARLDSYHWFGPNFTKFAENGGRLDAATARKGEHDGLGSISDLSMHADDLKVDVFGDVGITTFILRYSFKAGTDRIQKEARATLVFARERGGWRIVHEHLSVMKTNP